MKALVLTLFCFGSVAAEAVNFLDFQGDYLLSRKAAVLTGSAELCANFAKEPATERVVLSCKNSNSEDCTLDSNLGLNQVRRSFFQPKSTNFPDGSTSVEKNNYTVQSAENWSHLQVKDGNEYIESYKLSLAGPEIKLLYKNKFYQQKTLVNECSFEVPLIKNLNPPMIVAIKKGDLSEVQSLLALGADPNYRDYDNSGVRITEYAAASKSLELLKTLVAAGAELPSMLLSRAVDAGAMDIFDYLMQQPYTEHDYYYNLEAPIKRGNLRALQALVQAGAKPKQGHLHTAVRHSQIEIIKYLLSLGVPTQGYSSSLDEAARNNCGACAELLIAAGAKADFVHRDLHTPLMMAAANGSSAVLEILIRAGAGLDRNDSEFNRALSYASMYRHPSAIADLVRAGADLNFLSRAKMSPLMTAASGGDQESVEILLEAGANPCLVGRDGFTASQMAYVSGFNNIADLINQVKVCK